MLGKNAAVTEAELTIILPTYNRADLCKAHLRLLQACGIRHRVIVADSSDLLDDSLRESCTGVIEYRRFEPSISPWIKLTRVAQSISTPYVALMTDDDISFPRAIDACLDYLQHNPNYVVAQGYVLGCSVSESRIDIHSVKWFTPSIADPTPLRRLYELMRRYQPFFWAVFRTDVYIKAIEAANVARGAIFQELAFAATIALLGSSARIPVVQTLRGDEISHTPAAEAHPFFWFLKDAQSFFGEYVDYRDGLVDLLQELETGQPRPKRSRLYRLIKRLRRDTSVGGKAHIIDVIHATYFAREIDMGLVNQTAQTLLVDPVRSPQLPKPAQSEPAVGTGDLTYDSSISGRRYVWHSTVVNDSEVEISPEEIAQVEATLEKYDRQQ
jgi:glycosyltransferase domain-containing protein